MAVNYYTYGVEDWLNAEEFELYNAINTYRISLGLSEIPLSWALTTTAARHAVDTVENIGEFITTDNGGHSWSDAPYRGSDSGTYPNMWYAPDRIGTEYGSPGYEISVGYVGPGAVQNYAITAETALSGWQGSPGHNAVITNTGIWASLEWKAIGVAIYKGVSHVWFGEASDPLRFKGGIVNDVLLDNWSTDRDPTAFQVYRLYETTLDRAPDAEGHKSWTDAILNGLSPQQAALGFVNSAEFQAKYGATSNEQFVTLLYNNVLDRAPDAGGFTSWVNALESGMSRSAVVLGFSDSAEFIEQTESSFLPFSTAAAAGDNTGDVYRLYQATLDREPDAPGLLAWSGLLAEGIPKDAAVNGFVNSSEFQAKYGATDNSQFVTLLYDNVLGRSPDPGGLAGWTNALNSGMSRASVVGGFADSAEFIASTASALKAYMRSGLVADFADTLLATSEDDSLLGGIGADIFRFVQGTGGSDLVGDLELWDWVRFDGFGYSDASDVTDHMTQEAGAVVFSDQGQTIRFHAFDLGDFTDDMFVFV